jgi:hypothetical protein
MNCCARFDITVNHIPGTENILADTLSRCVSRRVYTLEDNYESIKLAQSQDTLSKIVKEFYETETYPEIKDAVVRKIFHQHINDWFVEDEIVKMTVTNMNGLIRTRTLLDHEMAVKMMTWIHKSIFGGHFSTQRTLEAFRECYFTMQDYKLAKETVDKCVHCRISKSPREMRPRLEPYPVFARPLEMMGMDMLGPLNPPTRDGYHYLLVLVDYCTKWPIVIPIRTKRTEEIAAAILHQVIPHYGLPKAMISDNAPEFIANALKLLYSKLGISKVDIAPYSPWMNGQCERMMSPITATLRLYCQDRTDWAEHIPAFLTSYRNTVNSSTLVSPFFALFGTDMRTPYRYLLQKEQPFQEHGMSQQGFINDQLQRLKKAHKFVSHNSGEAKKRQKEYYDKKAKDRVFEVGMTCVLRNKIKEKDVSKKLSPLYYKPSRIIRVFTTQVEVQTLVGKPSKPRLEHKANVRIIPEVDLMEYIRREIEQPFPQTYYADAKELAEIRAGHKREAREAKRKAKQKGPVA